MAPPTYVKFDDILSISYSIIDANITACFEKCLEYMKFLAWTYRIVFDFKFPTIVLHTKL